ncbi:MAG: hypothetical protein K6L80_02395 [Agarilytica sp.]
MKFKVRFQRRYSVMITIIACASSILMMVKRFGFPEEQVVQIIWVSLGFLVAIILVAAPIAFLGRWIAERADKQENLDHIEQNDP